MITGRSVEDILFEVSSKKLKVVNLSETSVPINEIPSDLFLLTEVEEIILGYNCFIREIPKEITQLKKLKVLSIYQSELVDFPLLLIEVKSLKALTLNSSLLKELPIELNEWKSLNQLKLLSCVSLNEINGVPPKLTYLFIDGKGFNTFPDKIFNLVKLKTLILKNFRLIELPSKLFTLKNLVSLDLSDNKLFMLPEAILELKKLAEVILDFNSFKIFPNVLTQIFTLTWLSISGNYIRVIPSSISNLKSLVQLDLSGNKLRDFQPALCELENLIHLNLGVSLDGNHNENNIQTIPSEIIKLKKLQILDTVGSTITNIPPEILMSGIKAIQNYFNSKSEADKEDFLYEAKMVVVGRGDVGKTVLTRKLSIPNYSLEKSETTRGISILRNPYEFQMDGLSNAKSFRFNIWDFGGQEKYDATHQLFITNRSIYLFLTEARAESNYQDVFHWLNTISLFSYNSPVVVVLSKFDERKKLLPETFYKEKFKNIVQFVDVSCADGYEYTIERLKLAIKEAINLLPQTKLTLSNHWIDIRKELEVLSHTKDYIEYNDYLSICRVNKLDKIRADFLSEYLNDLGVIIHHQQDILLRKTVFINTDWCVDGMYKVLDDDVVFQNKGKFTNKELFEIWNETKFLNKQAELIKLMRNYGLCFELSDQSGYIAPDLLTPDRPKNLSWDYADTLQFEYQYIFMPAGMVSRFIVKSHSFIKDDLYWKHGVVLKYDSTEGLVEEDYVNNKIRISIKGENSKDLLTAIRMFFGDIHKDFLKTNDIGFEEKIPCNCSVCKKADAPHFYKYRVLRNWEKKSIPSFPCEISGEIVTIASLISDIQIQKQDEHFTTDNDLKIFILKLMGDILERDITLKGGYLNFWRDKACKHPKDEVEVQPYICNTIDNYCSVNGINLSREVREANGNVDILFSYTNRDNELLRVCVEIKKSHHQDVENAISKQLPLYLESAGTQAGIYLVIWYKNENYLEPNKYEFKEELLNAIELNNPRNKSISVKMLDCNKGISPSKN